MPSGSGPVLFPDRASAMNRGYAETRFSEPLLTTSGRAFPTPETFSGPPGDTGLSVSSCSGFVVRAQVGLGWMAVQRHPVGAADKETNL